MAASRTKKRKKWIIHRPELGKEIDMLAEPEIDRILGFLGIGVEESETGSLDRDEKALIIMTEPTSKIKQALRLLRRK
jgi:hypothetical protein